MLVKKDIGVVEFEQEFKDRDRAGHFTIKGIEALYHYLDGLDFEIDFDVIAICCDFSEDTPGYYFEQYEVSSIDELRDIGTVIEVSATSIIFSE